MKKLVKSLFTNYDEQLKTERKFTLTEIKEVINLLPNNKAPGSDKIHVMFLKMLMIA